MSKPAVYPQEYHDANGRKDGIYFENNGETFYLATKKDELVPKRLCNFTADITEDRRLDDGDTSTRVFQIHAINHVDSSVAIVPAEEYGTMGWVHKDCGAAFRIEAGNGIKDHTRAAFQALSQPKLRKVYAHTGWENIKGEWYYLTGSGAIGKDGMALGIDVELDRNFELFRIAPPNCDENECLKASLSLMAIGDKHVTMPLLCAIYLAPLSSMFSYSKINFVPWFWGPSGRFKSAVLALAQSHYGLFGETELPGSFTSTPNAVERQWFTLKDALFIMDDMYPTGSQKESENQRQNADRLLRGAGNHKGRDRMMPDTRMRSGLPPRGLVCATAEKLPTEDMGSAMSRSFEIEFDPGCIDKDKLTKAQSKVKLYSGAMYTYLKWLAANYDSIEASVHDEYIQRRADIGSNAAHARQAGQVAHLLIGLTTFTRFCKERGLLTDLGAKKIELDAKFALTTRLDRNTERLRQMRPSSLFIDLFNAALSSGRIFLTDRSKNAPQSLEMGEPEQWGWTKTTLHAQGVNYSEYRPITASGWVGVVDDGGRFMDLDPDLLYRTIIQESQA